MPPCSAKTAAREQHQGSPHSTPPSPVGASRALRFPSASDTVLPFGISSTIFSQAICASGAGCCGRRQEAMYASSQPASLAVRQCACRLHRWGSRFVEAITGEQCRRGNCSTANTSISTLLKHHRAVVAGTPAFRRSWRDRWYSRLAPLSSAARRSRRQRPAWFPSSQPFGWW